MTINYRIYSASLEMRVRNQLSTVHKCIQKAWLFSRLQDASSGHCNHSPKCCSLISSLKASELLSWQLLSGWMIAPHWQMKGWQVAGVYTHSYKVAWGKSVLLRHVCHLSIINKEKYHKRFQVFCLLSSRLIAPDWQVTLKSTRCCCCMANWSFPASSGAGKLASGMKRRLSFSWIKYFRLLCDLFLPTQYPSCYRGSRSFYPENSTTGLGWPLETQRFPWGQTGHGTIRCQVRKTFLVLTWACCSKHPVVVAFVLVFNTAKKKPLPQSLCPSSSRYFCFYIISLTAITFPEVLICLALSIWQPLHALGHLSCPPLCSSW